MKSYYQLRSKNGTMEDFKTSIGGLGMNRDITSLVERKYFMAIEKYKGKKKIREGKYIITNEVPRVGKTPNVVPK